MKTRYRAEPSLASIAKALPAPEEARVRDVLAAAGADLPESLATLSDAIAAIVVERCAPKLHALVLGGVGHLIASRAVLRSATAGRG